MNLLMPGALGVWLVMNQLITWIRPRWFKPHHLHESRPHSGSDVGE